MNSPAGPQQRPAERPKKRIAMLLTVLRLAGVALLFYALLMFLMQRRLAFPGAERASERPTPTAPPGVTQVWLSTSEGRVEAWFVPTTVDAADAPTVVFAHGNYEMIDDWQDGLQDLAALGIHALAIEYPGYGHSEGSPSRTAIREAFALGYDWLVQSGGVHPGRIVAWGRSLGGGAASDLAADRPVGALILQSTFSSAMRMAREVFAPGFLVRDRWDNARVLRSYAGPVLLMHGVDDEVIRFGHAEALARSRRDLQVMPMPCGHNDCSWPQVQDLVVTFLLTNGLLGQ